MLNTRRNGRIHREPIFTFVSFYKRAREQKITLSRYKGYFIPSDCKFVEQSGDIIQWEQSNRTYIVTHGVSGVE